MKILHRRVFRKLPGAGELKKAVGRMDRSTALLSLKAAIGEAPIGRPSNPISLGHNPSQGKSVGDRTCVETLRVTCFGKGLWSSGSACINTLALYATIREQNLESVLPVPKLYEVRKEGKYTWFYFQHMGLDASKKLPVSQQQYKELRQKSVKELVAAGVHECSISHHRKNWHLIPQKGSPGSFRAMLVDHGGLSCKKKGKKRSRSGGR